MYKIVGTKGIMDFIGYKETEEEALELVSQWEKLGLACYITKEQVQ
jgi:hypothetical protein